MIIMGCRVLRRPFFCDALLGQATLSYPDPLKAAPNDAFPVFSGSFLQINYRKAVGILA
jgi:hypothetical protein